MVNKEQQLLVRALGALMDEYPECVHADYPVIDAIQKHLLYANDPNKESADVQAKAQISRGLLKELPKYLASYINEEIADLDFADGANKPSAVVEAISDSLEFWIQQGVEAFEGGAGTQECEVTVIPRKWRWSSDTMSRY